VKIYKTSVDSFIDEATRGRTERPVAYLQVVKRQRNGDRVDTASIAVVSIELVLAGWERGRTGDRVACLHGHGAGDLRGADPGVASQGRGNDPTTSQRTGSATRNARGSDVGRGGLRRSAKGVDSTGTGLNAMDTVLAISREAGGFDKVDA